MIGGVALRVSSPVLVGRAAEAAQLWAAFERAQAGPPTLLRLRAQQGCLDYRTFALSLARWSGDKLDDPVSRATCRGQSEFDQTR
jgi:hypothetical protein